MVLCASGTTWFDRRPVPALGGPARGDGRRERNPNAIARETFRTAVAADDATWTRGRGWALSIALMELAHHRDTNPVMARIAAHVIKEVVDEAAERAQRSQAYSTSMPYS